MQHTRYRRLTHGWRMLTLTLVVLTVVALRPQAVRADADDPVAGSEVRLTLPTATRAQPNANAPIAAQLPAFYVVSVIGRAVAPDGSQWALVATPEHQLLGWLPASDVFNGDAQVGFTFFTGVPTVTVANIPAFPVFPATPVFPVFPFFP